MSNLKVSKKFVEDFNAVMKKCGASQGEIDLMKEDIRSEKFPFEHYEKWIEIEIGRMKSGEA